MIKELSVSVLLFAVLGLADGLWRWKTAVGIGYHLYPIYGFIAGCLTGIGMWWLLIVKGNSPSIVRGAITATVGMAVFYYLRNYFCILHANVSVHLLRNDGWRGSMGDAPIGWLSGLGGAIVLAVMDILLFGWAFVLVGAAIGAWLVYEY